MLHCHHSYISKFIRLNCKYTFYITMVFTNYWAFHQSSFHIDSLQEFSNSNVRTVFCVIISSPCGRPIQFRRWELREKVSHSASQGQFMTLLYYNSCSCWIIHLDSSFLSCSMLTFVTVSYINQTEVYMELPDNSSRNSTQKHET